MMGFAGQLSLGHALYVGLGAYATAALYVHFGIGALDRLAGRDRGLRAGCGAVIGFLAFRFGVAGVYFAILTIAFAEFARIGFDHFGWVGGSAGFFLPVANYAGNDLWNLRGSPVMFYYVMLALHASRRFVLCHLLLAAASAITGWRSARTRRPRARSASTPSATRCIAVVISAGMTSVAGVFFAFYYNNLFPEQVFHIARSIELILAPIIGGIGTLFGPIIGAFLLTGLAEALLRADECVRLDVPGAKQVFYGICLLVVVMVLPDGVWPWLARKLGLDAGSDKPEA